MTHRARRVAAALLLVVAAPFAIARAAGGTAETLHVFAAASLADAFGDIAKSFEHAHPGTHVQLVLAGSQQLAAQIEQGAEADVFASADTLWMSDARANGRIDGEAAVFASNRLVVIVPSTNPARITRLQDLARRGVKIVLGADAVPVGHYSREALTRLAGLPGFDPGYAVAVRANVVSEEENVKSVVGKVQLGEADAGMCYRSDVSPAVSRFVHVFALPDSANVIATYPIAVVAGSRRAQAARDFVALVLSAEGQRALARARFGPPVAP